MQPRVLVNEMRSETDGDPKSSDVVILRFCLRMIVLIAFAILAGAGFGRSLVALLWMSTILSAFLAIARREIPLAPSLNYWDEAIVYITVCCALSIHQTGAI